MYKRTRNDQLDQFRQFRGRPAPDQLALHHLSRQRQPIVLLEPGFRGGDQTTRDGQQPGLAVAMPAPIDGDRSQTKIDGGEMAC
jgi:hypothetical protein